MPLLAGRTAIVTGGAQGLGFAIAEQFVAEGARVVIGDLDIEVTRSAADRLAGPGVTRGSAATSPPLGMSIAWSPLPWISSEAWTSW